MKQYPAVAILGARQVGKTTLAKQIVALQRKPFLYLDLENPLDVRRLEKIHSLFYQPINQLKPAGTDLYYYHTQVGAECDKVLSKGIHPIACAEIKLNNAPHISKENFKSIADLKTKKNFVVVPDIEEYKTKEGIIICNMKMFLQNIFRN